MTIHDTEDWSSPGGQGPAQVIGDPILTFGTLLLGEDPSGDAQPIQVDASGHILTTGGYASLTGAGQSTTPGELDQSGAFTVTTHPGDTVGIQLIDGGSGGILLETTGTGEIEITDSRGNDIVITSTDVISMNGLTEMDFGDSVVIRNSGGAGILDIVDNTANSVINIDLGGLGSQITIRATGSTTIGAEVNTGVVTVASSSQVALDGGNGGRVTVGVFTLDRVGFYGATGVAQQGRPVTLADVINVLVQLGLTA